MPRSGDAEMNVAVRFSSAPNFRAFKAQSSTRVLLRMTQKCEFHQWLTKFVVQTLLPPTVGRPTDPHSKLCVPRQQNLGSNRSDLGGRGSVAQVARRTKWVRSFPAAPGGSSGATSRCPIRHRRRDPPTRARRRPRRLSTAAAEKRGSPADASAHRRHAWQSSAPAWASTIGCPGARLPSPRPSTRTGQSRFHVSELVACNEPLAREDGNGPRSGRTRGPGTERA